MSIAQASSNPNFSFSELDLPAGVRWYARQKKNRLSGDMTLSVLGHLLVVGLFLLYFLLAELFGWTIPLLDPFQLKARDIEFVLVEAPSQPPRNPNTKLRAEKASRAGGQKVKNMRQAPNLRAAGAPNKTAAKPKPAPSKPAQSSKPASKPARPTPKPQRPSPQPKPVVSKTSSQQPSPQPPAPQPKQAEAPKAPPVKTQAPPRPALPAPVRPSIATPLPPPPKIGRSSPGSGGGGPISRTLPGGGAPGGSSSGTSGRPGPRAIPGQLSGAPGGGFGSGGSNSIDQFGSPGGGGGPDGVDALPSVDFGPYIAELQRRIKRNWVPPADNKDKRIVAVFTIRRDGRLVDIRLKNSSGVDVADNAAIQAIRVSAPFRPLPANFKGNTVDVLFTFDYNVLSGRSI